MGMASVLRGSLWPVATPLPTKAYVVVAATILLHVTGHPSGIGGGRASCGLEFDSPAKAFVVPDIGEGWYLRRISTCSAPYFWVSWEGKQDAQLYIAAISPEIERFKDQLEFHAVLFGPGLPTYTPPAGIDAPLTTGIELQPPPAYNTCAFVDTNPVMQAFSDLVEGRCMEQLSLPGDYKDPLRAGATWNSWWLYSHEHMHVGSGTHYLVSWLTDKSGSMAQGKYEITLGPHTWSGYASAAVQAEAQGQVTTCSCAMNALTYLEQRLERLGAPPAAFLEAELPMGTCKEALGGGTNPTSQCAAADLSPSSEGLEWAGVWDLLPGSYTWQFFAFRNKYATYAYPDRTMTIVAIKCSGLDAAQAAVRSAIAVASSKVVQHDGTILWRPEAQTLAFRDDETNEVSQKFPYTSYKLNVAEAGKYCIFTQHVPAEFLATFFTCGVGAACTNGSMVFPEQARLYVAPPPTQVTSAASTLIPMGILTTSLAVVSSAVSNATTSVGSAVPSVGVNTSASSTKFGKNVLAGLTTCLMITVLVANVASYFEQ